MAWMELAAKDHMAVTQATCSLNLKIFQARPSVSTLALRVTMEQAGPIILVVERVESR